MRSRSEIGTLLAIIGRFLGTNGGKFENHLRKTAWDSFTRFILTGAVVAKQKKAIEDPYKNKAFEQSDRIWL